MSNINKSRVAMLEQTAWYRCFGAAVEQPLVRLSAQGRRSFLAELDRDKHELFRVAKFGSGNAVEALWFENRPLVKHLRNLIKADEARHAKEKAAVHKKLQAAKRDLNMSPQQFLAQTQYWKSAKGYLRFGEMSSRHRKNALAYLLEMAWKYNTLVGSPSYERSDQFWRAMGTPPPGVLLWMKSQPLYKELDRRVSIDHMAGWEQLGYPDRDTTITFNGVTTALGSGRMFAQPVSMNLFNGVYPWR